MTEFGKKNCKKQPLRGRRASQKKKWRNKGAQKKQPLKKKGNTEKNTQGRCLFFWPKKRAPSNRICLYAMLIFFRKSWGAEKKSPNFTHSHLFSDFHPKSIFSNDNFAYSLGKKRHQSTTCSTIWINPITHSEFVFLSC